VARIKVDSVSKSFHSRSQVVPAVKEVSFSVEEGEFVTIIGPSGCGKSTLFNMIAGLLAPDSGVIRYLDLTPGSAGTARDPPGSVGPDGVSAHVGYMPQKDLLLPWLRTIDNAGLPLELGGFSRREARERTREHLGVFGLEGFELAYPHELSGGMRQRAALLRTVMTGREILLLDEPFGALDALTRKSMQAWLLQLVARLGLTVLFITHDVDEAVYLSDRVIVLSERPGRVVRTIPVKLERPRSFHMVESAAFGHTAATLLSDLGLQ
jgi:ABC-type nitrate/sulfonate/bicarbonate transport system ATPase subunit